jgi:hypothetical protein
MLGHDDSRNHSPQTYEPVVPTDLTRGSWHSAMGPPPQHTVQETRSSSDTSNASLKSPRTARFAEATSIHSPIEQAQRSPFADPPKSKAQGDVGDIGFGYVGANHQHTDDQVPMSPFRPDLKVPQTAKSLNPLSPTFREEYLLEKQEKKADVDNARDIVRNPSTAGLIFILTITRESKFASVSPRSSCVLSTSAAVSLSSLFWP